jgi:hypothetical protein
MKNEQDNPDSQSEQLGFPPDAWLALKRIKDALRLSKRAFELNEMARLALHLAQEDTDLEERGIGFRIVLSEEAIAHESNDGNLVNAHPRTFDATDLMALHGVAATFFDRRTGNTLNIYSGGCAIELVKLESSETNA